MGCLVGWFVCLLKGIKELMKEEQIEISNWNKRLILD